MHTQIIIDLISALWRVNLMSVFNGSLMIREQMLINVFEGLGFDHFYVHCPCNPFIKDYIF
jgi:hypothetical protein